MKSKPIPRQIAIRPIAPFGILLGPMLVGMFLCFAQRQQTGRTEFETVLTGFEQFLDAFVATLIMIAVSLVIITPLIIVLVLILFMTAASTGPNAENQLPVAMIASMVTFVPLLMAANLAICMPFLFTFQLIADRKVNAGDAVKASMHAAWINLGGILWYLTVTSLIYFLAMLPCYIPAILSLPIFVGSMWLLYQDVFGTLSDLTPQAN